MVDNILDAPISAADATTFVRDVFTSSPDPAQFGLEQFLPVRLVDSYKAKLRSGSRSISTARWRVYDARTPMGKRSATLNTEEWTFAPVGQILMQNEEETQKFYALGGGAIVDSLYDDLEISTIAVRSAYEMARGQILSTGVGALPTEDGTTIAVDFGLASNHKPSAATVWSNTASATPWSEERAWLQRIRLDGGTPPVAKVMSETVMGYLQANAEYRSAYAAAVGTSQVPALLTPAQLEVVRQQWGLPPIVLNDAVDGDGNRYWPSDKVGYFGASVGETQIGTTMEQRMLSGAGNPRLVGVSAPGLVGVVQQNFDPPRVDTKVASVGLPLIFDKNSILIGDVL